MIILPGRELKNNLKWLEQQHKNNLNIIIADICDKFVIEEAVRQVSHVFHLAAQVAVTTSLINPEYDYSVNAMGTINLLEAIRKSEHKPSLIFTSTNKVYDSLNDIGIKKNTTRYLPENSRITHFRVKPDERFTCDLSFLGNRLPDREERVKTFFLQVAEKMPDKQFMLGGSGWGDLNLPSNVRYVNHVYSRDHNAFNSSSTIVLNISRQSMADYGFSPATRIFEAAGAGARIITDYWKGIENFLTPGKEILVAGDGNEVESLLAGTSRDEAMSIGRAAKLRVLSDHTYEQRASLLNDIRRSSYLLPRMIHLNI